MGTGVEAIFACLIEKWLPQALWKLDFFDKKV